MSLLSGNINGIGLAAPITSLTFEWNSGAKCKAVENRGDIFPWVIEIRTHPVWGLVRWLSHPNGQEIGPFFTYDAAKTYAKAKIEAGV